MSVLARILAGKREELSEGKSRVPLADLRRRAADQEPARGFKGALERAQGLALIAEIKPASPSRGPIRPGLDAAEVARIYEDSGANALSVLTESRHFQGSLENLARARGAVKLPALRKDFLFDPYQITESRAWGADAVLLIAAALEINQLADLREQALESGMDALVEVHDERECDLAIELGCDLIGVNNRDLETLQTGLEVSERLMPRLARHALAVSESGLETRADLDRVEKAGARAVLIGTTFCLAPDIGAKVREVMGW